MRVALALVLLWLLTACGLELAPSGLECQRIPADGGEVREGQDPQAEGHVLAGRDVTDMSAEAVGRVVEQGGLGVTYRYHYLVGEQPDNGSGGYSECWCVPPPGPVSSVAYDAIGRVVVFVDSAEHRDSVRPQPERGWGCDDAASAPA
jgi:hypothetical protein